WKVIVPGASPFIIAGLRQALLRAFIAVIGAEMIAASDWGLGWVIFDAKEFLNADVMLAALIVIGGIGFALERLAFGALERASVRSEEHTSELQSPCNLVCRLLLEKKKKKTYKQRRKTKDITTRRRI